jgi:sialate O-acetylesterase
MQRSKLTFLPGLITLLILTGGCQKSEPLTVADLYGDNMVIQADAPIHIWGSGKPGARVQALFRDQDISGRISGEGLWDLELDPESYSPSDDRPDSLVIRSGKDQQVFRNLLVGEVWVCSGQSNMEMPLISNWASLNNAEEEVRQADYPGLRLFTVQRGISFQPVDTLVSEGWMECSPETIPGFSATAYFFGRDIHRSLGVPVGLIHSSWGGTVAEAWTSANSLRDFPGFAEHVRLMSEKAASMDSVRANYESELRQQAEEIAVLDIGIEGTDTVFAQGDMDVSGWTDMDLPRMWEGTELGVFDGSAWFVREVDLDETMAGSELTLCYGAPDDWDEAWVNGVRVGGSTEWDVPREYPIPSGVVHPGMNKIVIRVMDNGGAGGFMGEATHFALKSSNGTSISLAGGWKAHKGFDFRDVKIIPVSPFNPNQPTVLYNAMIHPLLPFHIRGAIWYQGESNAGRAFQYRSLFRTMIRDWRTQWGQGDFPFLFVQLANYMQRNSEPVEDAWAELREAQAMALQEPNTGMAVAIDIGDALDIHPGNKQEVGRRLALNALARVYDQDVPFSGPMYSSMEIQGNRIVLSFDYVLDGLSTSDNTPLKGFSICGEDRKFVWANAKITDNKVQVSAPGISNPIAVRYAWSSNPACNLVNSAGLPASPFRTDQFKGITEPEP